MKSRKSAEAFVEFAKAEIQQLIPVRFAQIVREYPDNIALSTRSHRFSYQELDVVTNRVAGAILAHLGEGPEPIALLMEHDAPAIIGILAILKAGKFYVPLEPRYPDSRNSYILSDTQTRLILTHSLNYARARNLPGNTADLLNIDTMDSQPAVTDIEPHGPPDGLAYVIYTSGSTGTPKGVMQNHRNVLHRVMTYTNSVRISVNDRVALLYSYGSSGSVRDIFGALLNGATLLPFNVRDEGWAPLTNWLIEEEITVYNSAATLFRHFAGNLSQADRFPRLRSIHVGSETIYKQDVELYKTHFSDDCVFVARLGSTEISPICEYPIDKKTEVVGNTVPAGYVIDGADAEILLLDDNGGEVGTNEIGEIAVKTPYLFPGYWRRPELTQAVFVADPAGGPEPVFRTGDLGRLRFDGCLEHLGRKDYQVKIRGHRVEIEEIEAILAEHPQVQDAAVALAEKNSEDKRLVAYVVLREPKTATEGDLRDFLKANLPDYMIPSAFLILTALPRTANGKLDRSGLEWHDPDPAVADAAVAPPRSAVEIVLANVWRDVLGINKISTHSDLFELGGDSLQAMQIVSRVCRDLKVELSLKTLFENSTLSRLAASILADPMTVAGIDRTARDILNGSHGSTIQRPAEPAGSTRAGSTQRDAVPLSLTQQELWFIDQLDPGRSSYNMAHAFRLQGPLGVSALERSVNEIIRRHESLRTTFDAVDGIPVQVIAATLTVNISLLDLTTLGETQRSEAGRLTAEEAQRSFDLAHGPLLRFTLLRLSELEHILVIVMHHIVSDGWSWGIFLAELTALYDALSTGRASPLVPLAFQYADFAQWQHQQLTEGVLEARLSYWQQQLDGAPTLLEFPTDYPRSRTQTAHGATEIEIVSPDLARRLRLLSRAEGVTLFMTLFAAFDALLFRWTGQDDIVVGSTITGRNRPELEDVIGLFINTSALRADLSGNPTFRELLGRVRQVALGAYTNQEVPFHKLMERLRAKRSGGQSTLFQVFFVLNQDSWRRNFTLRELAVSEIPVEMGTAQFDLAVFLVNGNDGLSCSFRYRTDLFDAATIRRFAAAYRLLLEGVVANPAARLAELPILSDAERLQMLVGWNDTQREYPHDSCLHELFEKQAKVTPTATAVSCQEERLSYRQLDRRSNQLANYLQAAGVYRGAFVGICMERSPDMVMALLAVLKSGAVYVPMDPKYARERLTSVLNDTKATVLLSDRRTAERVAIAGVRIICVDSERTVISRQSVEKPVIAVSPDDLAYVIYTSGSTGKPKGVEVTHRSLVNFVTFTCSSFNLEPADRVLQFASISFDAAVEDIFPCLIRGASLVLRTDSMLDSVPAFLARCQEWGITILDLPTAFWHELSATVCSEDVVLPPQLRLIVLGGERIIPLRLSQWMSYVGPQVRLLNTYGPTEATVVATTQDLSRSFLLNPAILEPSIGHPIFNVHVHILDRYLNPVPIGVRGELHIGGIGLARGYHKLADATAEKFIPNPFIDSPGERLYKTGDVARYLADGSIEFVGRLDEQIKIRGFRVEPGEIEAVLSEHGMVRQAAVLAREKGPGEMQLVAYVTLSDGAQLTELQLRGFLKGRLPEYMIPSVIVFLGALPFTPTGKIDRAALPDIDQSRSAQLTALIPPRTPMQHVLVEEWEEVLGVHPIGIKENFFDLGGQSLLAVRLIARIQKRIRKTIPVASLFESPTIEQFAELLEQEASLDDWCSLLKIQPNGFKLPFFWIHGELSNAVLPRYLGPDQPLYGVEHQAADGKTAEHTSVEAIAAHYLAQIRTVSPSGPYLLGGYSFGAVIAFEMAQQLTRHGEKVAFLFLLDPLTRSLVSPRRHFATEVRHHLGNVAVLPLRKALNYVFVRVSSQINDQRARIGEQFNNFCYRIYLSLGLRLPPRLRSPYILELYWRAGHEYVPQRYSGKVMLYKRKDSTYHLRFDWTRLIQGDLEIFEGTGEHLDMRTEPYVSVWAERLKESLERAQKTLPSR